MPETARELEFFFGTEVEYQETLKESLARCQQLEAALRRLVNTDDWPASPYVGFKKACPLCHALVEMECYADCPMHEARAALGREQKP